MWIYHGHKRANLFPAWAGVILMYVRTFSQKTTFPRMGGGDPERGVKYSRAEIFSPHGRG